VHSSAATPNGGVPGPPVGIVVVVVVGAGRTVVVVVGPPLPNCTFTVALFEDAPLVTV
jgi:hypothetical protein